MSDPIEPATPQHACSQFGTCGGCAMPGDDPGAEAGAKEERLRRALRKHYEPGLEMLAPLRSPPSPLGRRNRLGMRVEAEGESMIIGLPVRQSRELCDLEACPATDPRAEAAAFAVAAAAKQRNMEGLRSIVVQSSSTDDMQVTLVAETARLPHAQRLADAAIAEGTTGVLLNVHEGRGHRMFGRRTVPLAGRPFRREKIADLTLDLGPATFFEASTWGAEQLVATVRELAGEFEGRVVDLYAGCGMLSLALSKQASSIVQVEYVHDSARDAKRCAEKHGGDILALNRRVEDALRDLFDKTTAIAIVDPPRDGVPPGVVEQITKALRPRRVLLIGRAADVLARGLARFARGGLHCQKLVPLDSDPLSRELLVVAELER